MANEYAPQPDDLRTLVLERRITRRELLVRGTQLGLSAPVIAALLAACGGDDDDDDDAPTASAGQPTQPPAATSTAAGVATATQAGSEPTATEAEAAPTSAATGTTGGVAEGPGRGEGDLLRILYWQAATILNPHLATGDKDTHPARICLEPLLDYDAAGELVPILAAEVPSLENGMVAEDGTSVTYTLKEGIVWSDGTPFTAEDVKFTWEYIIDEAANATTIATYSVIESVEVIDDYTLTLHFGQPNPAWFNPFVGGYSGHVLPKHVLDEYRGAKAADAPFNLMPVGTGAFKVTSFAPGDVIIYELNELYRDESKPYFKQIEFKGGGDAASAGLAVMESGEADYAWNLQVEKAILDQLASGDAGRIDVLPWISVEMLFLNFADPNQEVDGARSEPSTQHPYFSDLKVRQAFAAAVDRDTIAEELYGQGGLATTNYLVQPERFASPNTSASFDLDQAAALLDEAGWVLDGDRRAKDGVQMETLFQTTTNPVRNKTQEVIKQSWEQLGISVELKSIDSAVYFSPDAGNPDTSAHFYADVQEHSTGSTSAYPVSHFARFKSTDPATDLAQKSNDWNGRNINRWVNAELNQLWETAQTELDPDKHADLFIGMNDLVVNEIVVIPMIHRALVSGISNKLKGISRSALTTDTWDVANWYFEE